PGRRPDSAARVPLEDCPHLADRVAGDERDVLYRASFPPPLRDERAAQIVEGDALRPRLLILPRRLKPAVGPRPSAGVDRDAERVSRPAKTISSCAPHSPSTACISMKDGRGNVSGRIAYRDTVS